MILQFSDLALKYSYNDVAWNFLRKLLEQEDPEKQHYQDVCKHILAQHAFIPKWLFDSYRLSKPSELLYLYLQYGRLDEASDLALDYVRAFLGLGSEMFGFVHYTRKSLPSFPINTIDLLLYHLKSFGEKDTKCKENFDLLYETVDTYLKKCKDLTLEGMIM